MGNRNVRGCQRASDAAARLDGWSRYASKYLYVPSSQRRLGSILIWHCFVNLKATWIRACAGTTASVIYFVRPVLPTVSMATTAIGTITFPQCSKAPSHLA